ncbi:MAG TPA: hypothetical protein VEW04_04715 [Allosphingosinicella sp.]|nr:hypothetical protein [Allosphingosinicella sp.]
MRRIIFLAAAALAACATVPAAEAGPTAALGQFAQVEGLSIRPLRVVEDSRCPINARCVWAGRMILHVEVTSGGGRAPYDLTLGEPIAYGGGRLALVAAEPGREAGHETDPSAYRFTFAYGR